MNLKFSRPLFSCSILFLSSYVSFAAPKDPCRVLTPTQIRSVAGMDVAPGEHYDNWRVCTWRVSERSAVGVAFMFVHQFYTFKRNMNRVIQIEHFADDAFYVYPQLGSKTSKTDTSYIPVGSTRFFFLKGDVGISVTVSGIPDDQKAADIERKLADEIASVL
jgi:hypothetical protein